MTAAKGVPRKVAAKRVYKPSPEITASVKIMGVVYEAKGASVIEALEKLNLGRNARGRGILTVSNGIRSTVRIIQPPMLMRLFSQSPLTRQTQLKNLYLLFDL